MASESIVPSPLPTYVYKILPSAPPTPLPSEYPLSELDRKDGFVHLSSATQVPTTADLFFTNATSIWLLKLKLALFEKDTKWEGPRGCAHLYGNFGAGEVESSREFSRAEGETWSAAFERQGGWLVDS
ncbi:hypothetical protein UCREL1_7560 [Eutypa lata UCREL1]|uniref:Duf952 domain protein n=1 Tax=Eutypa lata (strain UCR-EL1) TaxID=1287681 RepID=M7SM41_EUTLA|nr:hypothetical protein UCREL1_7560 [Eutypa lata UCREL1]